jgi:hypothetical protein
MEMEQAVEQAQQQVYDPVTGRFLPGRSANPRGRALRKDKIAAHVQDLVVEFCARHDRKPTPSEIAVIGSIALNLVNQARGPADPERSSRLSKEIRCDRQSLGLSGKPVRPNNNDARRLNNRLETLADAASEATDRLNHTISRMNATKPADAPMPSGRTLMQKQAADE